LSKLPYILTAIAIGGVLTIQPGLNAEVARRLANPLGAGLVSIFVSFVISLALVLGSRQSIAWGGLATMPWYLWFAGSIGMFFVIGTLWIAPVLGAALLFASIVAGQMIMATIADLTGFGGYDSHGLDPWRVAGVILVLAGVWAFQHAA
jgi:transporter family-2 protein